jgi:hypothetical protein
MPMHCTVRTRSLVAKVRCEWDTQASRLSDTAIISLWLSKHTRRQKLALQHLLALTGSVPINQSRISCYVNFCSSFISKFSFHKTVSFALHRLLLLFTAMSYLQGMQHEWGRGAMHIGYWCERQKGRDHWEDQDVDGWTILKWILER